jgi:uncharacterized protein YjbJ (UPF0337 family)
MSDLKRDSIEQQVKGTATDMKGRVKEAAGNLAGREDWEAEGQMDQAEGKVRKGVGMAGVKLRAPSDEINAPPRYPKRLPRAPALRGGRGASRCGASGWFASARSACRARRPPRWPAAPA